MKKMGWVLVALIAVIVIGGGGYYYLQEQGKKQAITQTRAALESIKTGVIKFSPEVKFNYGEIAVNAGDKTVSVADVKLVGPGGKTVMSASMATIGGSEKFLRTLRLSDFVIEENGQKALQIKSVTLSNLVINDIISPKNLINLAKTDPFKILAALDLGEMSIKNVTAVVEKTGKVYIEEIHLAGVKNGVLGRLNLTNVRANGKSFEVKEFSLGGLSVKNLDLTRIKELQAGAPPSNFLGVSEAIISNLVFVATASDAKITVARAGLDGVKRDGGLITAMRIFLEKAVIPLAAVKEAPREVQAFLKGIDQDAFRISAEFGTSLSLSLKTGVLKVGPIAISMAGMGALKINGELSDLDIPSLRRIAKGDMGGMENLGGKIVKLSLSYVDEKLADQILDNMAKGDRGKTAKEMSQIVAAMAGQDPDNAKMMAKAVHDFLLGAKHFKFQLHPAQPIAIMALQKIAMGPTAGKDLNIQVSGN